jgi:hypothetical protein
MALARCQSHRPMGRSEPYVSFAEPYQHSQAVICGLSHCSTPAVIWLTGDEKNAYDGGERYFGYQSATSRVRAA